MAFISEQNGHFVAEIKSGERRIFKDRDTAMIWLRYKQDLLDEMEAFSFSKKDLVTFEDALALKKEELEKEGKDLRDYDILKDVFSEFLSRELEGIKYEELLEKAKVIAETPIYRGGAGDGKTGSKRLPAKRTVVKRFVLLATVYSYMNDIGFPLVNEAQKVCAWLRDNMKDNTEVI